MIGMDLTKPELPVKTGGKRHFSMKTHLQKMGYFISEFPLDRFFSSLPC